jgi:hypothetical protein
MAALIFCNSNCLVVVQISPLQSYLSEAAYLAMRQGTCCKCGLNAQIRSFYAFNGKAYCEPCVWKVSSEAKDRGEPSEYISLSDNSICARCGVYSGDTVDHTIVGDISLCPSCSGRVTNWP